jgi:hypothetical protein
MRFATPLLLPLLMMSLAVIARGEDNPDFPQIHPQPNPGQGTSQFQPNPAYGGQNATGAPNPNPGIVPNGARAGGGARNNGSGVDPGPSGPVLHNNMAPAAATDPVSADPVPGPMSSEDALANFTTVVETYVATKSPKGYWPFMEKPTGKKPVAWRLTEPEVIEDSVKKLAGEKYSGRVKLRDVRGGRPPKLQFVVDFSGVKWKVVSVTPEAKVR